MMNVEEAGEIRSHLRTVEISARALLNTDPLSNRYPDHKHQTALALALMRGTFQSAWGAGSQAFTAILRAYQMSQSERRVMETAARFFNVKTKRFSASEKVVPQTLVDEMGKNLLAWVNVGRNIVDRDVACTDVCTTACFRTSNSGGFSPKVMGVARAVIDDGAKRVEEAGFGKLCYGEVIVTKTVMANARILAFYDGSDDRMYVRANLKEGELENAVGTVIHELGHRLDRKFLTREQKNAFDRLYFEWKDLERRGVVDARKHLPQLGERVTDMQKRTWEVLGLEYPLRGTEKDVLVKLVAVNGVAAPDEGKPLLGKIKESKWHQAFSHKAVSIFPTPYSRTDVHEFIAECFRFYVLGTLTPEQRAPVAAILGSGLASASLHASRRVASSPRQRRAG